MGKVYEEIDASLSAFIANQPLFFVATAPLSEDGLVNLSPKGLDSFRILDARTVAYADLTGSGVETVAHVKENGRIVVMFCAFSGAPKIVRIHGAAEVLEPHHDEFAPLKAHFPQYPTLRSIIRIRCRRISDSCGFGVPQMELSGERHILGSLRPKQTRQDLLDYQRAKNCVSLDGLPGVEVAQDE